MLKKLSIGLAALATCGFAGQAFAADVEVHILVEDIAFLVVENDTGNMIIDDGSDTAMGHPSSGGSLLNINSPADYALVRLNTNHNISYVQGDFDTVDNIRNIGHVDWPADTAVHSGIYQWFGKAIGQSDSQTLGVYPFLATVNEGTGALGTLHWHNDPPLVPQDGDLRSSAYGNGTHLIAVGVAGQWANTLVGEPIFAAPQTYVIPITLTIVP